jgi:DNA-binding IscR family transcriptional regulator
MAFWRARAARAAGTRFRNRPIGRIIRLVEGPLAPVSCVSRSGYRPCPDCPDKAACPIRLVMKEVRDAISQVLDQKTLASLADETDQPPGADWFMVDILPKR